MEQTKKEPAKTVMFKISNRKHRKETSRYFSIGSAASFTGIIPSAGLPSVFDFFPLETPIYFIAAYYIFLVLWILFTIRSEMRRRIKTS